MGIEITKEELEKLGFRHITEEESPFQYFNMPYYVKDQMLLFYNNTDPRNIFLLGYGEMRNGVYFAVSIRWITTLAEVHQSYQFFKGKELVSML